MMSLAPRMARMAVRVCVAVVAVGRMEGSAVFVREHQSQTQIDKDPKHSHDEHHLAVDRLGLALQPQQRATVRLGHQNRGDDP